MKKHMDTEKLGKDWERMQARKRKRCNERVVLASDKYGGVWYYKATALTTPEITAYRDLADCFLISNKASRDTLGHAIEFMKAQGLGNVRAELPCFSFRLYKVYAYAPDMPNMFVLDNCAGITANIDKAGLFNNTIPPKDYLLRTFRNTEGLTVCYL